MEPTSIHLTLSPDQLALLDAWIAAQPEPQPSRPAAIRQLLALSFGAMTANVPKKRLHG